VPTFSRAISRVNVKLKTNVSEISSVYIIRVDVVNDRISLIFIPDCQIDASSYRFWFNIDTANRPRKF
jgi:hypothetical protein